MRLMLNQFRRHTIALKPDGTPKCSYLAKGKTPGREETKCSCPIHYDGVIDSARIRDSLKTRDWARAASRLREIEAKLERGGGPVNRQSKPLADAAADFLKTGRDLGHGTQRNNVRIIGHLVRIAGDSDISGTEQIALEFFDTYRDARPITARTWVKELAVLKHFLRFCFARGWHDGRFLHELRPPKVKDLEKRPYTEDEMIAILKACDMLGRAAYERIRAKACVMLLRHTAMRISDVVRLKRDRIKGNGIETYTVKGGKPLWLPLPSDVIAVLDSLPRPRGAAGESDYFFWSGNGTTRALDRDFSRTLHRVFKHSKVDGAHAHRFRHTLATRLLEKGWTFDDVALVLGNSPAIVRKYYAQWSKGRQDRVSEMMADLGPETANTGFSEGTKKAQSQTEAVN